MNQSELESEKMRKCHVWPITNQNLYPQNSVSQKSTHFFRLVFIHLLVRQGWNAIEWETGNPVHWGTKVDKCRFIWRNKFQKNYVFELLKSLETQFVHLVKIATWPERTKITNMLIVWTTNFFHSSGIGM